MLAAFCAGPPVAPSPPKEAASDRAETYARLLEAEDRRTFDPALFGRAAASPDPWLRSKAALAAGRLRDPDASALLPALLRDPDSSVRRSAAFAAGVSGEPRMVGVSVEALSDPDSATAAFAAEALGKLGGPEATAVLLGALGRPGPARPAAAKALFRTDDSKVVAALALVALDAATPPDVHGAAIYALARRPSR